MYPKVCPQSCRTMLRNRCGSHAENSIESDAETHAGKRASPSFLDAYSVQRFHNVDQAVWPSCALVSLEIVRRYNLPILELPMIRLRQAPSCESCQEYTRGKAVSARRWGPRIMNDAYSGVRNSSCGTSGNTQVRARQPRVCLSARRLAQRSQKGETTLQPPMPPRRGAWC